MKKPIFLQNSEWAQIHSCGIKKYQNIFAVFVYISFFVTTYLTINFLGNTLDKVIISPLDWSSYVPNLIMQFFHTTLLTYFLSKAFVRLYEVHRNHKCYWIWFVIYLFSGAANYGLWFYLSKHYPTGSNNFLNLIYFGYILYFIMYLSFIELLYNFYSFLFNRNVHGSNNSQLKVYMIFWFLVFVYSLGISFLFTSSEVFLAKRLEFFLYFLEIDISKTIIIIIVSFLIILPWLALMIYSFFVKKIKQKSVFKSIFKDRLIIIFALSNFFYFLVESFSKDIIFFNQINTIYLVIAIVLFLILGILLIANHLNFNSAALYFLSINFVWLVLIWVLVIFYSVFDVSNIFTQTNSIIMIFASFITLGSIFFNNYGMKKIERTIFNFSLSIISLLFLTLVFIGKSIFELNLSNFDAFLLIYVCISCLVLINLNVFLFGFVLSLKRLMKKPLNNTEIRFKK